MTAALAVEDELALAEIEVAILTRLAAGQPVRTIAAQLDMTKHGVHQRSARYQHDRARLRAAAADARAEVRRLRGDLPAVEVALQLSAAARNRDGRPFAELAARSDRAGLLQLVTVLAGMLPPDTDPAAALEWVDLPPREWSQATLQRETDRWRAGARDRTAVAARQVVR